MSIGNPDLRRAFVCLASTVLVVTLLIGSPAGALTLQPGQYKMEWRVPRWADAVSSVMRQGMLKPIEQEQIDRIKGLKSNSPLWTTIDGRVVIVDELDGDQTGYNTVYVLTSYKADETVDLAAALRLTLLNRGSISSSEETPDARLDITLGSGDARVVRSAGIQVQVGMQKDPTRGNVPYNAVTTLFGNWFGRISSDDGDVELQLIDHNSNGTFSDVVKLDSETSSHVPGDIVFISRGAGSGTAVALGPVLRCEGKLYDISVTPTGESVEIQPYKGATGTLSFETRDGTGAIVQTGEVVNFLSVALGGLDVKSGDQVVVPVGSYQCVPTVTFGPRKKKGDPGFIVTVKTRRSASVEEGKTAVFALGGPVTCAIDPDAESLEWTAGTQARVKVLFFAGEDELNSLGLPDPVVTLMIRDAAGRAVGRARPNLNLGNPRFYALKVFDYLAPGPYWLSASFEPGEYAPGKTVVAHKPVRIGAAAK